jgi:hypothetical protein
MSVQGIGSRRPWLRRTASSDVVAVLRTLISIFVRHWPVLFALSFAGLGARAFLDYAAARLNHVNGVVSLLVFILVPITTMAAMIAMLRILRRSLPWLATVPETPQGGRRMLDAIGSVLIPFLAVYASYGYLQADRSQYYYGTWIADPTSSVGLPDRLSAVLVVAIVAAIGVRWVLGRWSWAVRRPWIGIVRAYLEIVWIGVVASVFEPVGEAGWSWLTDRRVVHWGVDATDRVGQMGEPIHRVMDWFGGLLGSADTVVAVPIAWLTVGAIVYGREIVVSDPRGRDARLARTVARRLIRLPRFIRRLTEPIRDGLQERFGPLVGGLRVLTRVGLASMVLFCLLFLLAQTTAVWLFELERALIGPRNLFHFWMPISGPLSVVNDAIQTVLLVCLLAAAADRVLSVQATAAMVSQVRIPVPRAVDSTIAAAATSEPEAATSEPTVGFDDAVTMPRGISIVDALKVTNGIARTDEVVPVDGVVTGM